MAIVYLKLPFSAFPGIIDLNEPSHRAVVCPLYVRREYTGGQLVRFQVVGDTFTAFALPGARLIGAVAFGLVGLNLAFHCFSYV
jgi:hypothetical protein